MSEEAGRGVHDIGGLEAGPVDTVDHVLLPWHKLATALSNVIGSAKHNIICTDETRRTREEQDQKTYDQGYFERQTESLRAILLEKGVLEGGELESKITEITKRITEQGR